MAEQNAQEPTMEEILASIRRIISEDDAPAAPAEEGAPAAAAAPEPAPEPEADLEDDVLELTEKFEPPPPPEPETTAAPPVTTLGDLDVFSAELEVASAPEPAPPPPAPPPPAPRPAPAPVAAAPAWSDPSPLDDSLLSAPMADTAASYFGQLARTVAMPAGGRDLEAVVRELLRPMLKDWLDAHLPAIVEAQVQAEVERIARRR